MTHSLRNNVLVVRQFEASVVEGPDRGLRSASGGEDLSIGTSPGNTLQLSDPSVSRHHCTLRVVERGLELRDHGSTNGTFLGESELKHGYLKSGVRLRLGTSVVQIELLDQEIEHPLAQGAAFGGLLGASPAMRRLYPLLERFAQSSASVLIEGETGSGKELVAETLHQLGRRRAS